MAKESKFQSDLKHDLRQLFPGCIILKNDASAIQGIPDLTILYEDKWAALECKRSEDAGHQPNQDYYVGEMNKMSYASFVYPENKEKVLDEIQQAFRPHRPTRISKRK
jgi:hypothetical protein